MVCFGLSLDRRNGLRGVSGKRGRRMTVGRVLSRSSWACGNCARRELNVSYIAAVSFLFLFLVCCELNAGNQSGLLRWRLRSRNLLALGNVVFPADPTLLFFFYNVSVINQLTVRVYSAEDASSCVRVCAIWTRSGEEDDLGRRPGLTTEGLRRGRTFMAILRSDKTNIAHYFARVRSTAATEALDFSGALCFFTTNIRPLPRRRVRACAINGRGNPVAESGKRLLIYIYLCIGSRKPATTAMDLESGFFGFSKVLNPTLMRTDRFLNYGWERARTR